MDNDPVFHTHIYVVGLAKMVYYSLSLPRPPYTARSLFLLMSIVPQTPNSGAPATTPTPKPIASVAERTVPFPPPLLMEPIGAGVEPVTKFVPPDGTRVARNGVGVSPKSPPSGKTVATAVGVGLYDTPKHVRVACVCAYAGSNSWCRDG